MGICVLELRGSLCLIGICQIIAGEGQVFLSCVFYVALQAINHYSIIFSQVNNERRRVFPAFILCFTYIAVQHYSAQVVALHGVDAVEQGATICIAEGVAAKGGTEVAAKAIVARVVERWYQLHTADAVTLFEFQTVGGREGEVVTTALSAVTHEGVTLGEIVFHRGL